MTYIERKLKSVDFCQVSTAHISGPTPATHLFTCAGNIAIDPGNLTDPGNQILISPFSFILPDNDRQYLALKDNNGNPLTMLSATAMVAFSSNAVGKALRKIKGSFVQQQGQYALLTINIWQNSRNYMEDTLNDIDMGYYVTILAGPTKKD